MKNSLISKTALWLLLSILSAASMAFYVAEIWSVNQPSHFTDFYAPWWGAHELLLHHRNPYSPAVAHEIQTVIYGAASSTSIDDPSNIEGGFAYPPYTALLLWPTVYLSFSEAEKTFLCLSALATLLSFALWLRVFRFPPSVQWLIIAIFAFGSFPTLQALKLENLSLMAAALITVTVFLLSANRLVLAGVLLALSTFKPQFTIALIPWLALWTVGDWRHRRRLVGGFLVTMGLLVLISEWIVPSWIRSFFHVLGAYRHYTYGHSLFDVWFTPKLGLLVSACVLLAVLALSWKHRSEPADSMQFLLVTSLLLAVTLVVIPTLAPHAQLLLLPGLFYLLRRGAWSSSGALAALAAAATWALMAWPWLATFGLVLLAVRVPIHTLLRFWDIPLYTSPLLPLAVAFALGSLLSSAPGAGGREFHGLSPGFDLPSDPAKPEP